MTEADNDDARQYQWRDEAERQRQQCTCSSTNPYPYAERANADCPVHGWRAQQQRAESATDLVTPDAGESAFRWKIPGGADFMLCLYCAADATDISDLCPACKYNREIIRKLSVTPDMGEGELLCKATVIWARIKFEGLADEAEQGDQKCPSTD